MYSFLDNQSQTSGYSSFARGFFIADFEKSDFWVILTQNLQTYILTQLN